MFFITKPLYQLNYSWFSSSTGVNRLYQKKNCLLGFPILDSFNKYSLFGFRNKKAPPENCGSNSIWQSYNIDSLVTRECFKQPKRLLIRKLSPKSRFYSSFSKNDLSNNENNFDDAIQEYQRMIIDYSTNQTEWPTWTKISNKFCFEKICSNEIFQDFKIWYKRLNKEELMTNRLNLQKSKSDNLSINNTKTRVKVRSKLPKLPRNNFLDVEKEKIKILKYLERYRDKKTDFYKPISWTVIGNTLYRNYSLESRKPLKIWYQNVYEKNLRDIYGWSTHQNIDIQKSDLGSHKDLPSALSKVFEQMKHIVKNVKDPRLSQYYHDFFQEFSSDFVMHTCLNKSTAAVNRIPLFNSVTDITSFKKYLSDTLGLYSRLCLYTMDHPFPLKEAVIQVNHHLMPQFLEREYSYGFTKEQINKSYNVVSISWLIHFLMHLTRLVEYAQAQDESAITIIVKQQSQKNKKNLTIESWNPFKPFAKNALEILKTDMLQNYPQFEQNLAEFITKRARTSASNRMYPQVKKVLIRDSRWCYVNPTDPNDTKEFIFKGQDPEKLLSLKDLSLQLINVIETNQLVLGRSGSKKQKETKLDYKKFSDSIGQYLQGKRLSVFNFYLVDAEPPVKKPFVKRP